MSVTLLLPMAAFALAASISPGPVNLVCLSTGIRHSLGIGFRFVSGATAGFIALFVAIGFGLQSVVSAVPGFSDWLRGAGVLFLLYLSYRLATDQGLLPEQAASEPPTFITGAAMQWLNPKAWLASAAGIGAYTPESAPHSLLLFALVYAPICWLSLASWVYAGAYLRRHVSNAATLRNMNRALAFLLASSCLLLLRE